MMLHQKSFERKWGCKVLTSDDIPSRFQVLEQQDKLPFTVLACAGTLYCAASVKHLSIQFMLFGTLRSRWVVQLGRLRATAVCSTIETIR